MTRVAVITVVHGRHEHLRLQRTGLGAGTERADDHVVVAMDDDALRVWHPEGDPAPHVVPIARQPDGLPLAAARNLGADVALARGAEILIFLDVDCIPSPTLVEAYRLAAEDQRTSGMLLCGPVAYLPPPPPSGYDLATVELLAPPHPARPTPGAGQVELGGDHNLFWSLSFALTRETWERIGGFCAEYVGYGGEDTDFSRAAASLGIELAWVGSALAHHQYHEVELPPVRHLDDILRNGAIFASRWGEWPMPGWLERFRELGLVTRGSDGSWQRTSHTVEGMTGIEPA